jgi:iron complex transport system ATP-binding protein
MLLDEITAFLDLPRRIGIMHLLSSLAHAQGLGIVVSTHDLELALRTADRLWLFSANRLRVGAPEDLVLRGAFDEAFVSDGLEFDRDHGTFTSHAAGRGLVAVIGEGLAVRWTARAVERAGYMVAAVDQATTLRVEVNEARDPHWLLVRADTVEPIATLEMLVARLRVASAHDASAASADRL